MGGGGCRFYFINARIFLIKKPRVSFQVLFNLFGLFLPLQIIFTLQGYFRNPPKTPFKTSIYLTFPRLFSPCKVIFALQGKRYKNHPLGNRTIAIASGFSVDGAKSPEILQKEGVSGSDIAARNRKSLATFHRTLKSQMQHGFVLPRKSLAISGVCHGHRNRKSKNAAISVP